MTETPEQVDAAADSLHRLALRYWSDGRSEDALRVALEAAEMLADRRPASPLLTEITATIASLEGEQDGPSA